MSLELFRDRLNRSRLYPDDIKCSIIHSQLKTLMRVGSLGSSDILTMKTLQNIRKTHFACGVPGGNSLENGSTLSAALELLGQYLGLKPGHVGTKSRLRSTSEKLSPFIKESSSELPKAKIGLIHTSDVLVPMFTDLSRELMPTVEALNFADNQLVKDILALGATSSAVSDRLLGHIREAQKAGVDAIMVTCSSLGPSIESLQALVEVPLIRVDEAMAALAVSMATRIGVIATVSTTLGPTAELIERRARDVGKSIEVMVGLCEGALEKLLAGDVSVHDKMVSERLLVMIPKVDVVVLAQASMARVTSQLPQELCTVPILSSPRLAMEALAKRIGQGAI